MYWPFSIDLYSVRRYYYNCYWFVQVVIILCFMCVWVAWTIIYYYLYYNIKCRKSYDRLCVGIIKHYIHIVRSAHNNVQSVTEINYIFIHYLINYNYVMSYLHLNNNKFNIKINIFIKPKKTIVYNKVKVSFVYKSFWVNYIGRFFLLRSYLSVYLLTYLFMYLPACTDYIILLYTS